MAKMNLSEQEASAIRSQFGDFLTGRSSDDKTNWLMAASEATMHVDNHTDTHDDSAS